jgi:omega-6 fatty acid desaturase (delta-12 desaturase)
MTTTVDTAPDDAAPAGSLLPVLRVIPPEAYENPTWKGLAYFARDAALYAACIVGLIAFSNPLIVLPLWFGVGLTVIALFVIGHDCAHQALFKSRRINDTIGRIAMLPSWHVYEGWVLGHNRVHHQFTVREGYDFVWHPYTPAQYTAMSPLARLRHRFEWSFLGAGAYYLREVWWHKMAVGEPPKRFAKAIRKDRLLVLGAVSLAAIALVATNLAGGGSIISAAWLVARVLVVPFLIFNFSIGSLVHVHHVQPDIRWWKRRDWTKFAAQVEGTTVLRTPKWLDFFFHQIMIHVPHHVDSRIPMYNLEMAAEAIAKAFPETMHDEPLRFRDFVRNTRQCKLYDFDNGRWFTYREASALAEVG